MFVSLLEPERSTSSPLRKSCQKKSGLMETEGLSDIEIGMER